MSAALFLKTFLLGLSIAAPVGPIGLLCIQRTLRSGMSAGFLSGLGAATADACYGALAAYGLAAASQFFLEYRRLLAFGGGVFLLYLGLDILRARKAASEESSSQAAHEGVFRIWATTCLLTLANPMTILSFTALFSSLVGEMTWSSGNVPLVMISGFFAGSLAWWLFLSGSVALLRRAISPATTLVINRLSGAVILLFGAYALGTAVLQ
jgi:threonine/homoserine/homoserine lactone efflux protein